MRYWNKHTSFWYHCYFISNNCMQTYCSSLMLDISGWILN